MSEFIDQVAASLGLSRGVCENIARTAHRRYKVFLIPKKNGRGFRTVAQPAREVKAIQRTLVLMLDQLLPVHPAATAYRPGSSILRNARAHVRAKYITKLDFEAFFPCIDRTSLGRHLRQHLSHLDGDDIAFILSACCWTPKGTTTQRLCIGAPSSPMLSNSIMHDIDSDIQTYCEEVGAVYTRYSDDICISATMPDVLAPLEQRIRHRIRESTRPTLTLNEAKRVAVGRGSAMNVTGLVLSNQGAVTVGRERKRGVRAGVMRYLKGALDLNETARLKGELAYVISIEPGFRFVLTKTYGMEIQAILPSAGI